MVESPREQLQRMMYAIQKMRSVTFENYEAWIGGWKEPGDFSRPTLESHGAVTEPLLFGEGCILSNIAKCLDGEPTFVDVMNFELLLRDSHLYRIVSMRAYGVSQLTVGGVEL